MAINLDIILATVANIVVGSIIVSPILWLAGRAIVGKEKAKFTDALWIVFLGNVIGGSLALFGAPSLSGSLLSSSVRSYN